MSTRSRARRARPPHRRPSSSLLVAMAATAAIWALALSPSTAPRATLVAATVRPEPSVRVSRPRVAPVVARPAPPAPTTRAGIVWLIHRDFPRSAWADAVAIVGCESHFHYNEVATDTNGTHDIGVFQLNDGGTLQEILTGLGHPASDTALALDPVWNVRGAAFLFHRDGWGRWVCASEVL